MNLHLISTFPTERNKHSLKWTRSTEVVQEIIQIPQTLRFFELAKNYCLEIDPGGLSDWMDAKELLSNTHSSTLTFYTDGSLHKEGPPLDPTVTMGAAWLNLETELSFKHRIEGTASSTNPEAKAILSAIEISPPNRTIHIYTDSQCAQLRLLAIARNEYGNTPISHILKISGWQTWEVIYNITRAKEIKIKVTKVEAYSGNPLNDTVDTLAKEARSLRNPVYVHNNEAVSRIHFALACRGTIVEKNTRKFLKHISQNLHRGSWTAHHTSKATVDAAEKHDIDWQMYREILKTDGKFKSGFTSTKTTRLRAYIVKLMTNTLPTMDILHRKWSIYLNDLCPRCTKTIETNDHVWNCEQSEQTLKTLIKEFTEKYRIPNDTQTDVVLALRGIPTKTLVTHLKDYHCRNSPAPDEDTSSKFANTLDNKINKSLLGLIEQERQRIWKPRNEIAISMQEMWNISAKDKRPRSKKGTTSSDLQPEQANLVSPQTIVLIDNSKLNKKYDPYRCHCGLHSLIHTPGKRCDLAGVILQRARNLALSVDRRQISIFPLINILNIV